MKAMILTGLATEQAFSNPDPKFYLVFNNGELKVPIPQKTAEEVIKFMYGTAEESVEEVENNETDLPNGAYSIPSTESQDEDGIDQI
jgi:hypothetical protein